MIDPATYVLIANSCDDFVNDADSAGNELTEMASVVSSSTSASRAKVVFLIDQISRATPSQTTSNLQSAVAQLQSLVVAEAGSVDAYLASHSITVKPLFAAFSAALGFPISASYVS
jgi:hypothetical protein